MTLDSRAWTMLFALAALWGGTFFLTEIALREVGPLTLAAWRVTIAAAALWVVVLARGRRVPRDAKSWGAYAVMGLLNNAIPFGLIMWGQTRIEGGLASIINAMTAIFGAFAAGALLPDERLTARKILGAALGVAGVAIIIGPDALSGLDPRNLGQLAVLAATVSYAFASVWGRVALAGRAVEINAAGMLTMAAIPLWPVAMAIEGAPRAVSGEIWAAILGIALGATALAYLLYFAILKRAGAANTMLVTLLIPPFAIGLGAVFLHERLAPSAWLGFGVIALGLMVIDGRLFNRAPRV